MKEAELESVDQSYNVFARHFDSISQGFLHYDANEYTTRNGNANPVAAIMVLL